MSTSFSLSKFPHPTRMIFEALRRRPDMKVTNRELYNDIHRLYPSRMRKPGETTEPTLVNGIVIPTMPHETQYPDHPIPSYNQFKQSLLPYLAKSGLIQKYSYGGSSSQGKTVQPKFAWRFNPSYPSPPLVPHSTPLPKPFPASTPSTTFHPIDVDGLLAMPKTWDSHRKSVCLNPHQELARKVGEYQKLNGVFEKTPKVSIPRANSKQPPKTRYHQLVYDLKINCELGLLKKSRQRMRVKKTMEFEQWKEDIEEQWARRGPEMLKEGMEKEQAKEQRRLIRQAEQDGEDVEELERRLIA